MIFTKTETFGQPELVVLFISYEERSTRAALELKSIGYSGRIILLYCHDLIYETTIKNIQIIYDLFPNNPIEKIPVSYKHSYELIKKIRAIKFPETILVDISCLTEVIYSHFFGQKDLV